MFTSTQSAAPASFFQKRHSKFWCFFKGVLPFVLICFISFSNPIVAQTSTVTRSAADDDKKVSCAFTGPQLVCPGSTNQYTATTTTLSGGDTYNWTVTGAGTIVGASTANSVSIKAGSSCNTQYTVTFRHLKKWQE